eukprot:GILJ01001455.1.p1 GENE.GILJ01001455.1~~GILJ01001455.1.p1  ORF type:complete len:502 (+),score=77.00 GILJ01001455.1:41-1546(+)
MTSSLSVHRLLPFIGIAGAAAIVALAFKSKKLKCCTRRGRKILVLGAGFVAGPLVDYLLKRSDNQITVASLYLRDAEALANGRSNVHPVSLNVADEAAVEALVAKHEIVISFVPYTLHVPIARLCIKHKKHMVTASYVSDAMRELDAPAKAAGVVIFNEIGLDPGIDHLAAMKVIDEVKELGGRVHAFESWCGGLPAPEHCDNPLGYKFSWSPRGALMGVMNPAVYTKNSQRVEIAAGSLLSTVKPLSLHMAYNFEGYANRDSLKYIDAYGLHGIETMFRGTVRYNGYSLIVGSFVSLGLMNDGKNPLLEESSTQISTWLEAILMLAPPAAISSPMTEAICASLNISHVQLAESILVKTGLAARESDATTVLKAFRWLGFFSDEKLIKKGTFIDTLCAMLEKKLVYKQGEKDLVFMQHRFGITWADGSKENRTSTLIAVGKKNGPSAMSRTVGIPAGVAAQMILDGSVASRGVIIPTSKDVYLPLITELENEGIRLVEEVV